MSSGHGKRLRHTQPLSRGLADKRWLVIGGILWGCFHLDVSTVAMRIIGGDAAYFSVLVLGDCGQGIVQGNEFNS